MIKVLKFLNLLDATGEAISLTNVGLIAILAKIVLAKEMDYPSIVALVSVLGNYMHKRNNTESPDAPK